MAPMRSAILLALLLAACGGDPLVVTIPLKPGATFLEMPEALPLRRYQYQLEVKNVPPPQPSTKSPSRLSSNSLTRRSA